MEKKLFALFFPPNTESFIKTKQGSFKKLWREDTANPVPFMSGKKQIIRGLQFRFKFHVMARKVTKSSKLLGLKEIWLLLSQCT